MQIHPDSDFVETHMKAIAEHMGGALEIIDSILSELYYGPMSESLASTLAQWETPGVNLAKMPVRGAGFTRSNTAP